MKRALLTSARALLPASLVVLLVSQDAHGRGHCALESVIRLGGGGLSQAPSLSADGRFVAFHSTADNLVPGDNNFHGDVFVYDRLTCMIERVSVSSAGAQGNLSSSDPDISDDGRFVVFESQASNLAPDTNGFALDVFVRDRLLDTTTLVSVDSSGIQPSDASLDPDISGDGRVVTFASLASTLVPGDTNGSADVFVRDLVAGTTERASVATSGAESVSPGFGVFDPVLSGDGQFVTFASIMPTLVTGDFNNARDVFVRDRLAGTTTRVSVTSSGSEGAAGAASSAPAISGDGRYVTFQSSADLVPGDETCDGIYVRDLHVNSTSCLPLRPPGSGFMSNAIRPAINADGRYIAFSSPTSYVRGDTGEFDVYVYDRVINTIRRVSTAPDGRQANSSVNEDTIGLSADGQVIGYTSSATNLVFGDLNGTVDVFVAQWPLLADTPYVDVIQNGSFTGALQNWLTFATPDPSFIVTQLSAGVLEFYRQPPPPGTSNQAVVLQQTAARFLAQAPIEARFDLGNSSNVRKRVTVLLHESDFSDLSVCNFWLPANAPLRTYVMRSHTTQFWTNATISFYAASEGSDGGFYRLDNVKIFSVPEQDDDRTDCVDPHAPTAVGGAAGPNLLSNSAFDTGLPPWLTFGQIVSQIASGIFEFYRPAGTPAGVVFQQTGTPLAPHEILTANFYLGNSSSVRKRVTVLLHDASFNDLSSCAFWLPPGLPLAPYRMRSYATQAWSNATVSIYPATIGDDQWIQLDNVTLQTTPAASTDGTNCLEPGADILTALRRSRPMTERPSRSVGAASPPVPAHRDDPRAFTAVSHGRETLVLWQDVVDLTQSMSSRLIFESQLHAVRSRGEMQISEDGLMWHTVALVPESNEWLPLSVDLDAFLGRVLHVRIVLTATEAGDRLALREVRIVAEGASSSWK